MVYAMDIGCGVKVVPLIVIVNGWGLTPCKDCDTYFTRSIKFLNWNIFSFLSFILFWSFYLKPHPSKFHATKRYKFGYFYKFCQGCEAVSALSNGLVTYNIPNIEGRYSYGTVVTYSCNNGYYISTGSNQRTCQSTSQWNGSPAVCQRGKWLISKI